MSDHQYKRSAWQNDYLTCLPTISPACNKADMPSNFARPGKVGPLLGAWLLMVGGADIGGKYLMDAS